MFSFQLLVVIEFLSLPRTDRQDGLPPRGGGGRVGKGSLPTPPFSPGEDQGARSFLALPTLYPLQGRGRKDAPPLLFTRGGTERAIAPPLSRCSPHLFSNRAGGGFSAPLFKGGGEERGSRPPKSLLIVLNGLRCIKGLKWVVCSEKIAAFFCICLLRLCWGSAKIIRNS